jgi:hypothetical protein
VLRILVPRTQAEVRLPVRVCNKSERFGPDLRARFFMGLSKEHSPRYGAGCC